MRGLLSIVSLRHILCIIRTRAAFMMVQRYQGIRSWERLMRIRFLMQVRSDALRLERRRDCLRTMGSGRWADRSYDMHVDCNCGPCFARRESMSPRSLARAGRAEHHNARRTAFSFCYESTTVSAVPLGRSTALLSYSVLEDQSSRRSCRMIVTPIGLADRAAKGPRIKR